MTERSNYRIAALSSRDFAGTSEFAQKFRVGSRRASPGQFETDAAREAAIRCFRTRGYEAISIEDLLAEIVITAASLYNVFGDKATVFRSVFERHVETGINARLRPFETLPSR